MELPPLPDIFGNYAIRGIVEVLPPGAVSWWPQTDGWILVALLLAAALGRWSWRRWQRWQRDRYRRTALAILAQQANDEAGQQVAGGSQHWDKRFLKGSLCKGPQNIVFRHFDDFLEGWGGCASSQLAR